MILKKLISKDTHRLKVTRWKMAFQGNGIVKTTEVALLSPNKIDFNN